MSSFLEEFEGTQQEDPFFGIDGSLILMDPSDSFPNDSLMKEFETELLASEQDRPQHDDPFPFSQSSPQPFDPAPPQQTQQQPQTLHHHPLYSHLSHSANEISNHQAPHFQQHHQNQHPHQLQHQPQQIQQPPPMQAPPPQQYRPHQYSPFQQHFPLPPQQQNPAPPQSMSRPMDFSPIQLSSSSEGINLKKRKTFHCATSAPTSSPFTPLRPLAPQLPKTQFVALSTPPPSPPPPPPKGHLMSSTSKAPPSSSHLFFPQPLAPSLSDSETRCLSEDYTGGELRMIAPKPPSLPPADFHQRPTQKPPHDSIFSSPTTKRTRTRTKRRSVSKVERGQKERMMLEKGGFLEGDELKNQLAILRAKFAASEAESRALKERLTATESELAELRLKVQQYDTITNETTSSDLHTPVALSPNDDMMTTPSPTFC